MPTAGRRGPPARAVRSDGAVGRAGSRVGVDRQPADFAGGADADGARVARAGGAPAAVGGGRRRLPVVVAPPPVVPPPPVVAAAGGRRAAAGRRRRRLPRRSVVPAAAGGAGGVLRRPADCSAPWGCWPCRRDWSCLGSGLAESRESAMPSRTPAMPPRRWTTRRECPDRP